MEVTLAPGQLGKGRGGLLLYPDQGEGLTEMIKGMLGPVMKTMI